MWIAKSNYWHANTSPLEKFAIESIIQRCDFTESISKKHRTSNGYTQLKELIHYCELSFHRSKTARTLLITLEESKSPYIKQNITADCIIEKYFQDLRDYITKFDCNTILTSGKQPNLPVLQNLTRKLKLFEKQLDSLYFTNLSDELTSVNYKETKKIHRNAQYIESLIDILIPYLVFRGYSLTSISGILRRWLQRGYPITMQKFLSFFHFGKRPFKFIHYLGSESKEATDFRNLMRTGLNIKTTNIPGSKMNTAFLQKHDLPNKGLYVKYSLSTLDPNNHVRSIFDQLLKQLVVQRERESLAVFNNFFENSLWSNKYKSNDKLDRFRRVSLDGDPISLKERARTLRDTLAKSADEHSFEFSKDDNIRSVELTKLRNSIYYYHLALCSKSIENSLSLLWTALESIHPFSVTTSDIDAIQDFVSNGLSAGAFSRNIHSFAARFHQVHSQNNSCFDKTGAPLNKNIYTSSGLYSWYQWIKTAESPEKTFKIIKKSSELLAYEFHNLSKQIREGTQSSLANRMLASSHSMRYQLQRIYLHRNKIVHSGDMVNEYTNLWMHLEWYVGKILAYFIIFHDLVGTKQPLDALYLDLQGDQNYLLSYLVKNGEKKIADLPHRIETLLFKHSWLAY